MVVQDFATVRMYPEKVGLEVDVVWRLVTDKEGAVKKAKRIMTYLWETVKYYVLFPIALWKCRGRKIWLVAERGTDARDNGYHFYRYIREKYPEIEVYYAITEDSPDRSKVEPLGNVVLYGSLLHYLLFIAAEYKISTHINGYLPYIYFYFRFGRLLPWKGKRIFLQHGVTQNNIHGLYAEKTCLDLFICGAKPEFDYVSANFHYNDEVKYTGLARYDALHDAKTKEQILLMPTWRMFLQNRAEEEIAESDYVTRWNAVLQDPRLLEALKQSGKTLVFYPHYEVQKKFLHLFSAKDPSVVIADFDHYDVQQLLKESQLLVTDYSSVFFDFAYMKKPSVYYQFDEAEFFAGHYKRGYFDYREMGFGEVVVEHEALVDTIIDYLENDCRMKEKYEKRIEGFFPLHDTHNCERIFEEIQKLKD